MMKPRTRSTASLKRVSSYSWPPKILTTFWPSIVSCSTWLMSPMACWVSRVSLRNRRLNSRTTRAMGGIVAKVISVSFQFSHSR